MSDIGWIVGSLGEREAAEEFLNDNTAAEPRDELHIAPLRDSISDALFPGITTQQTRAKYFLFGALISRRIETGRRSSRSVWEQIRAEETDVLESLKAGTDRDGIIGSKQWKIPGRGPTSIYWNGLATWGLRTEHVSMPTYVRWLGGSRRLARRFVSDELEDREAPTLWSPRLAEFESALDQPKIGLNREEASFLRDSILQIEDSGYRPVLKDLALRDTRLRGELWAQSPVPNRSPEVAALLRDAERLSSAIQGAMYLYNYLCAAKKRDFSSRTWWAEACDEWINEEPPAKWRDWDLSAALGNFQRVLGKRGVRSARPFLQPWHARLCVVKGSLHRDSEAKRLIAAREKKVKGARARLADPPGPALSSWEPVGVGSGRIQFRWRQVKRILNDIAAGRTGRNK